MMYTDEEGAIPEKWKEAKEEEEEEEEEEESMRLIWKVGGTICTVLYTKQSKLFTNSGLACSARLCDGSNSRTSTYPFQ